MKYKSVTEMLRDISDDPEFVKSFEQLVKKRRTTKQIRALFWTLDQRITSIVDSTIEDGPNYIERWLDLYEQVARELNS